MVEPGLWFQYDFGDGPTIGGRPTILFCAWLAWSRFRVVLPMLDRTLPTVIACLDTTLRRFGGCPTYALTDNEKTVTVEHVAGIAIRNPALVAYFGANRSVVSGESDQLFRLNPISRFGAIRSP